MKKGIVLCLIMILTGCALPKDTYILDGYSRKEEYFDKEGFQDYTDYCFYYYKESQDALFQNNKSYNRIEEKDLENILSYFDDFEKWVYLREMNHYHFDKNNITAGDYVHIETKEGQKIGNDVYRKLDNYSLYLYDIETHTLIYIHNNI